MLKRFFLSILILGSFFARAQKPVEDSTLIYDELFSAMDEFMDSILAPHSFGVVNIGAGNSYYNYESSTSTTMETKMKMTYTPSIGYFHKNGLGIASAVNIVNDGKKINPFQASLTGSYDYLKNMRFATGVSYSRFFTKKNLPFYTSPLQNSVGSYFLYRKFWLKPSVSATYSWGSRTSYQDREEQITSLRLKSKGFTRINTQESINDFSLIASIRHDFYWLNIIGKKDFVRLTPQVSFTSGSQKFGMNQTSTTYGSTRLTGASVLYSSNEAYLDDQLYFQPLSVTASLKMQYSINQFFVQPQFLVDYYLPVKTNNISTLFLLNAGFIF